MHGQQNINKVRKYFKKAVYCNVADELNIPRITFGPLFPSVTVENAKWVFCLEFIQNDGK